MEGTVYAGNHFEKQEKRYGDAAALDGAVHRRGGRFHFRLRVVGKRQCGTGGCADGNRRHLDAGGVDSVLRTEDPQAAGGAGADPVRQICGHAEGGWVLLCESVLCRSKSRSQDAAQSKRRCGRRRGQVYCAYGKPDERQHGVDEPENLPENHDPEQQPAEDQRLSGQPGGDRHCGDVAGGGYR